MSAVAFFLNTFSRDFEIVSPDSVILAIQQGQWRENVEFLWSLGKREYKQEKQKLPAVTWSGTFGKGTRSITSLINYSHLIVLDVDDLDISTVNPLKEQLMCDEFVRYCFVSPSAVGMKIVVQVNTSKDMHRHAFLHLQDYYEKKYLIKIDSSGKDCSRLCYVSWDPTAFINQQSQVFQVDEMYGNIQTEYAISPEMQEEMIMASRKFAVAVGWVERNKAYRDGEKNVFIHGVACAMNRLGVRPETTISLIRQNYSTPNDLWLQSIKSAYVLNTHEHDTIALRDIPSVGTFVAPAFSATYSEDSALNKLLTVSGTLQQYNLPREFTMDVLRQLLAYYNDNNYVNSKIHTVPAIMNAAFQFITQLKARESETKKLDWKTPDQMATEIVNMNFMNGIKTFIDPIDEKTGGLHVGNFYAIIGFAETFKSILAEYIAFKNSVSGVPVLVLNGEMSRVQYMERLSLRCLGISLRQAIKGNVLNKETIESFNEQILKASGGNLFTFSGTDFNKESILATIDHIFHSTGKKVQLVIMDGLSQMDQQNKEEAPANIANSMVCKEIVKLANNGEGVAMLSLCHCSGKENKLIRNTGSVVRGGSKLIANMDGYFSTSLFVDPHQKNEDNPDDINFMEGKWCLRYNDKRGGTGTHYVVLNLGSDLSVEYEATDYRQYELKA